MTIEKERELKSLAIRIRLGILETIHSLGSGHLGGSLSIADVLAALYGNEMHYDPKNPKMPDRDKLVCSKGHAGPAVYSVLAVEGFFPREQLLTLNRPHTNLPSHCDRNKTVGVDMTTGSLGQGTSLACGMAMGDRLRGYDSRTFLIVGDGESEEGQVWEACSFAAAKKLSNLVLLLDWNKKQLDGYQEKVLSMGDYVAKFNAFGFDTQIVNGNDVVAVAEALEYTRRGGDKPFAIVLDTVKGAGIPEAENTLNNHSMSVSDANYAEWTAMLEEQLKALEVEA